MFLPDMDLIGQAAGWAARTDLRLLFLFLLLVLMAASEAGFLMGRRALRRRRAAAAADPEEPNAEKDSVGFVTAGMLGLLAFLLGVSLSMGQSRYDARRDVVRDEANAIGTVWLRTLFLGEPASAEMRMLLREYTELRLQAVNDPGLMREMSPGLQRTSVLQNELWGLATPNALAAPDQNKALLIYAMNEMFDLSLSSRRSFNDRVPIGVLQMLLWATIISVGVVGYNFGLGGSRQPLVTTLLLAFWSAGLVLIVDINNPQIGVVRVDPSPLAWTIQGFGPAP